MKFLVYCAGQWGLSVRFIHITFSCHHIDRHSMSDIRTSTIHTNHIPWPTAHSLTHSLLYVCMYTGGISVSPLPSQPTFSNPLERKQPLNTSQSPSSRYTPSQRSKTSHTHPSIHPPIHTSFLAIYSRAQFFFFKKKGPRSKSQISKPFIHMLYTWRTYLTHPKITNAQHRTAPHSTAQHSKPKVKSPKKKKKQTTTYSYHTI